VLAFVLGGCSPSGGGQDSGPDASIVPLPSPALSPAEACREIATAVAQREVACQRLATSDEAVFIAGHCPSTWYEVEMADFDAGLLAYSESAVSCVVTFQQQLACNFQPGTNSQCGALGWGVGLAGQSCGSPYACQPGLYCQFTDSNNCGTCVAASAIGGPCGGAAGGATCLQGQCNGETCATVVGVGGDCQYGTQVCQVGLSCQNFCVAPGPVGAGCADDSDCQDGLTCNSAAQPICAEREVLGAQCADVSCSFGLGCAWFADGGTSCQTLTSGGSCVDDQDGGLCLETQHCVDGGCLPLGVVGSQCGQNTDCAIGRCVSQSCTLLDTGPCQRNQDCISLRCDTSLPTPSCVTSCTQ
jgi:hypothetical protein